MAWLEALAGVEALEDAPLDAALIAQFERAAPQVRARAIRFSTPTFKAYSSCELEGCGKNAFPAFSVTAGGCALMCDHCQAKILEPMIPATSPEMLERKVRDLVATQELQGFLLSGGSTRRNEIRYERFYPVIETLKRDFPHLKVAIHSALLDERRARLMEAAGVDTAMMDVIGAQETIRDVYHLDRPVEDFEATLAALTSTSMEVVPHIVVGLHYGRIVGEANALDIVSRHAVHSLVLVVVMPFYARPGTFETPRTEDVVEIPVRYDGPDLADVAAHWGVDEAEVARVHAGAEYRVAFCGFAPGFGYLTGLPREVPRRATPRTSVPAGSVALAGPYTGVYPRASPGGWQLIGTTDAVLWDHTRVPAALLAPGTRVRFTPVEAP